jgi:predicted RNA binding protein YcfA (HicA-like mRNA interferase family)
MGRVAKAREVRRALQGLGWEYVGRVGSHRKYRKGSATRIFAHHDSVDLGGPALARIAKDYGVQLDELRRLL